MGRLGLALSDSRPLRLVVDPSKCGLNSQITRVAPVAARVVTEVSYVTRINHENEVSYVKRINHENQFSWQAQ